MNVRFLRLIQRRFEAAREIDGEVIGDETRRRGLTVLKALIEAVEADPRTVARQAAGLSGSFMSDLRAALNSYSLPAGMGLTPDVRAAADRLFYAAMREAAQATAREWGPRLTGSMSGTGRKNKVKEMKTGATGRAVRRWPVPARKPNDRRSERRSSVRSGASAKGLSCRPPGRSASWSTPCGGEAK